MHGCSGGELGGGGCGGGCGWGGSCGCGVSGEGAKGVGKALSGFASALSDEGAGSEAGVKG